MDFSLHIYIYILVLYTHTHTSGKWMVLCLKYVMLTAHFRHMLLPASSRTSRSHRCSWWVGEQWAILGAETRRSAERDAGEPSESWGFDPDQRAAQQGDSPEQTGIIHPAVWERRCITRSSLWRVWDHVFSSNSCRNVSCSSGTHDRSGSREGERVVHHRPSVQSGAPEDASLPPKHSHWGSHQW